jgi:predicted ArsR family transcriptional regulator
VVREKILEALKASGELMSAGDIAAKSGVELHRVRPELFRLMGEGKVEGKQMGGQMKWSLKSEVPSEKRYEKMARKLTS